jgi:hypothetical protein
MLNLKPGARLKSAVCAAEVMVVKGSGDIDLRCGGAPLQPMDTNQEAQISSTFAEGTLMGKRYASDDGLVELLCTRAGDGSLCIGEVPLGIKQAQQLPSSD